MSDSLTTLQAIAPIVFAFSILTLLTTASFIAFSDWKKKELKTKRDFVDPETLPRTRTESLGVPRAAMWETSDVINLKHFFGTGSGQKLLQRARAMEYANAVAGCKDAFHTTHSAGRGAGFTDALNWLESQASDEMFSKLSRSSGVQEENPVATQEDERALTERYSP